MPFRRTDKGKIHYPKGISSEDRRFCRRVYNTFGEYFGSESQRKIIIACSGGLDSTVLAHVCAQACTITGIDKLNIRLVYIDHGLRNKVELAQDAVHVITLAESLDFSGEVIKVEVAEGNVQEQARIARYNALSVKANVLGNGTVFLAHHANDVAETKLFQFITGRNVTGIEPKLSWTIGKKGSEYTVDFVRPFLNLTRSDLERYASIWNLKWSEDSSNCTNKYTRNKIRRELLPWIEKEINPGIVKMLSGLD